MMNSLPKDSTLSLLPTQPVLTISFLGNTRYKSPSLRSSVTNSTRTSKISQPSPKMREEDFYKGKGELMNNLVEHNIFLKRELNLQERVIIKREKDCEENKLLGRRKNEEQEYGQIGIIRERYREFRKKQS